MRSQSKSPTATRLFDAGIFSGVDSIRSRTQSAIDSCSLTEAVRARDHHATVDRIAAGYDPVPALAPMSTSPKNFVFLMRYLSDDDIERTLPCARTLARSPDYVQRHCADMLYAWICARVIARIIVRCDVHGEVL